MHAPRRILFALILPAILHPCLSIAAEKTLNVAVVTTVWRQNSHADVIAGRLLEGYDLNGQGEFPKLKLAALYSDQVPPGDKSRDLAKKHGFKIYDSIAGALTLGGDKLAVDGVLMIAEHGEYPRNPSGSTMYPKRRLFGEIVKVFEQSGRVVPVFSDKHLSDNWADIEWIATTAKKMNIPMMAGSSLPTLWREPPIDLKRDEPVRELVGVSYGGLDSYGFHSLEMAQCLVERRRGGEAGIKQVRALSGDAVWAAGRDGSYDVKLLDEAASRWQVKPLKEGKTIEQLVKEPVAFMLEYRDGLKVSILTLPGAAAEWSCAWRYGDGTTASTLFAAEEGRPFRHFTHLLKNAEQLIETGKPNWPVERTVLTSGALDALLNSYVSDGKIIETPYLNISYQSNFNWQQPPAIK